MPVWLAKSTSRQRTCTYLINATYYPVIAVFVAYCHMYALVTGGIAEN